MKKLLAVIALASILTGCDSHERVTYVQQPAPVVAAAPAQVTVVHDNTSPMLAAGAGVAAGYMLGRSSQPNVIVHKHYDRRPVVHNTTVIQNVKNINVSKTNVNVNKTTNISSKKLSLRKK